MTLAFEHWKPCLTFVLNLATSPTETAGWPYDRDKLVAALERLFDLIIGSAMDIRMMNW